jgi:predicted nucleotidyltransferase
VQCDCGDAEAMKASEALQANRQELQALAERHRLRNLRVFGSVAMGTDSDGSDVDLLVDASADVTLFDLGGFQVRAARLLRVPVDVVRSADIPNDARDRVLKEAVAV